MIFPSTHFRRLAVILLTFLAIVGAVGPLLAAQPTVAQSQTSGQAIPSSCEEVKNNPQGQGPDYRVVTDSCEIQLEGGDILSNVYFKAGGSRVNIRATGAGWTIRNVAITGHGNPDDPPLNLQVNSRSGVGLVANTWISDGDSNALFVHPNHAGKIRFDRVTFLNLGEDGAYASRPGNPSSITTGNSKIRGQGGIVGFNQAYIKNMGTGPKSGYGLRLGSDGSYVTNSTIVETTGPALANTFASGKDSNRHPDAFTGVLFRNVDVVQPNGGTGIRVNNHQDGLRGQRQRTTITTLENVRIDASVPIEENEAGGKDPIIRGDYGTGASTAPPPGAPRSPERAASGIGGGAGSIGGPVTGPISPVIDPIGGIAGAIIVTVLVAILFIVFVFIVLPLVAAFIFVLMGSSGK